ncbi:hypothetical protein [Trichocoleus sp. FACHB-262]|uniref:hypothetical protein n=1 Tax=Trichocoleus sp. FACHB-262 TaxID=2692869 RepID=UPI001687AB14|nr:hypothetical protein [Trichocoleus sp. FACHB-262]MBD2123978.1 hypothetical protein [Trichocoleus sp. FACHB-262]
MVGLTPVGFIADRLNAVWYAAEGDYENAAVSALGILPGGEVATGARLTNRASELLNRASGAYGAVEEARETVEGVSEVVREVNNGNSAGAAFALAETALSIPGRRDDHDRSEENIRDSQPVAVGARRGDQSRPSTAVETPSATTPNRNSRADSAPAPRSGGSGNSNQPPQDPPTGGGGSPSTSPEPNPPSRPAITAPPLRPAITAGDKEQLARLRVESDPHHGHARHGAQTTLAQHERRVSMGLSPDNTLSIRRRNNGDVVSRPPDRSTRFSSYSHEDQAVRRGLEEMQGKPTIVVNSSGEAKIWARHKAIVVGGPPEGYGDGIEAVRSSTPTFAVNSAGETDVLRSVNGNLLPYRTVQPTGANPNALLVPFYNWPAQKWEFVTRYPTNEPVTSWEAANLPRSGN